MADDLSYDFVENPFPYEEMEVGYPYYGANMFLISTAIPLGFLLNLILVCLILRSKSLRAIPAFWLLVVVASASVWISFYNFNSILYELGKKSLLQTSFCGFLHASAQFCTFILYPIVGIFMIDRIGTMRKLQNVQSSDTQQSQCIPAKVTFALAVVIIIGSVILELIIFFGMNGIVYFQDVDICYLVGPSSPIMSLIVHSIIPFMFVMTTAIAFIPIIVMWLKSKSGSAMQREVALPSMLTSLAVIITVLPSGLLFFVDIAGAFGFYDTSAVFVLRFMKYWIHVLLPLIWILAGPIRKEICKSAADEDPMNESSHLIMK